MSQSGGTGAPQLVGGGTGAAAGEAAVVVGGAVVVVMAQNTANHEISQGNLQKNAQK